MKKTKPILYISSTVIATIIGAGFATGQEIYSFFNIYGTKSIFGLAVMFILFCFAFCSVLEFCYTNRIDDFGGFLQKLKLGRLGRITEALVAMFSLCGLCAMAAASGALMFQMFDLPHVYGVTLMLILSGVTLLFEVRGIAHINFFLAPLICGGLFFVCLHAFMFRSVEAFAPMHYYTDAGQILLSAILYVSYNILSVVVVLCSMRSYCDSIKMIRCACILAAGVLTLLAFIIWAVIELYSGKIHLGDIPLLTVTLRGGRTMGFVFSTLLFASIFTTAVSCAFSVRGFLKKRFKVSNAMSVVILTLLSAPICMFGFSGIVRSLYAIFGYLGLPFMLILILAHIKLRRIRRRKSKNMENESN